MSTIDHTLHVLIPIDGRAISEVLRLAERSVAGGATVLQLRAKRSTTRHFVDTAEAVRRETAGAGVPLIINDRVDVALASDAHGVHLGRLDLPPRAARRLLGGDAAVGVTLTGEQPDMPEPAAAASYAGVGPVFPTTSKPDAPPPMGVARLHAIAGTCSVPVVAIGGVRPDRVGVCVAGRVLGIAVVAAVLDAPDPRAAAADLVRRVREARAIAETARP